MDRLPLRQRELVERLRWFVWLRWAAVLGLGCAITASVFALRLPIPAGALYLLLVLIALYNFVCHSYVALHYRQLSVATTGIPAATLANVQIILDLVFLALFLHFGGGVENPFVFYFIFHMIIASILLSRRAAFAQATLAVGLMTGVVAAEYFGVLTHYHLGIQLVPDLSQSGYAWALLFVFVTTMYISVYMATSITTRLREREAEIVELSHDLEEKARQLEQSYEDLSRTQKLQVTYMRKTSHELRSPLAAIESMLTVILEGLAGEVPTKVTELVERSVFRLRALLRTVNDLLILLRSRDAHLERDMRHVDLSACAETVAELLRPRADAKRLTLEVDAPTGLPAVLADPDGMEQLCTNLIANAIKYTMAGGRVSVKMQARDNGVELVVADSGIGIPAEDLPKLFNEFFRASNAREHEEIGSGLGLSIVRSIVDSHHGTIDIQSARGKGTTFSTWLPTAPHHGAPAPALADRQSGPQSAP